MIELLTDYTRRCLEENNGNCGDKKLLWQGKVLLQECQTYARYIMNSGPELCLFFIWRFLSSVLCNFLHGSTGIKTPGCPISDLFTNWTIFSRFSAGASAPWHGFKNPSHKLNILSLWFPAFIKTNYVDNYLRFHALKPAANIKPTVHREFVEF